jgi:hypothetical protein
VKVRVRPDNNYTNPTLFCTSRSTTTTISVHNPLVQGMNSRPNGISCFAPILKARGIEFLLCHPKNGLTLSFALDGYTYGYPRIRITWVSRLLFSPCVNGPYFYIISTGICNNFLFRLGGGGEGNLRQLFLLCYRAFCFVVSFSRPPRQPLRRRRRRRFLPAPPVP